MFEALAFKNAPSHEALIDIGALAEALIFYGRVVVVGNTATLKHLLHLIPPFVLLNLLQDKRLELHYLSDQCGITSTDLGNDRHLHGLIKFSSPDHTIEKVAPASFLAAAGSAAQAKLGARRFTDLISPFDHSGFDQTSVLRALADPAATEASVRSMLRVAAPDYQPARELRFRIDQEAQGFFVDTNIDFETLNSHYHKVVPPSHSSMTEGYVLALLQGAYEATYLAAALDSEVAVAPVEQSVHAETVKAVVARQTNSQTQVARFLDLTLANARAIREAVNSGKVPFSAVVKLLDSADKFRDWLRNQAPDSDLLRAYYQETVKDSWAERLPAKTGRWGVFTTLGMGADALGAGGLGTLSALGISAIDAFIVDKLVKGWKPHQFVEGELKPVIENQTTGHL